ncbi:sensor histidine kinase RegB [uncultured Litoreibacter sp.]|uniref:sensor histidine kinase RegB n=1 Tax=uncultured Litoreibacter sp. TaxID=1392394 RepID=UPI0026323FF6|nr:ActS/PrrB/RegB family redox-sensitive histidine kinase [uncultured Litoreibacter sp.]
MTDLSAGLGESRSRNGMVRLRTLIILRWLAILGQGSAIFIASQLLKLDIPLGFCMLAIGASVISNMVAIAIYPQNRWLPENEVLLTLLFDLSQLAFLVYLTGGLNNPFALLILAPVTVSAMTMRTQSTLLIGGLAIVLVSALTTFHIPLRTDQGTILEMPDVFVAGFWVAIMIGIVFLAIYAGRVTSETRSMSQALLATQMALSREQKLTDLGGVVAAAAHELGTPLATIKLVSAELLEELEDRPDLRDDAALIREQADRCRDILHSMGRAGKDDLHLRNAPLSAVVEEAAEPHSGRGKAVHFNFTADTEDDGPMPVILRKPEIIHGLRNLMQNAVDFAEAEVWIDASWSRDQVVIRVIDDGPGYPVDLLGRIGEPFIGRRRNKRQSSSRPEYEGMGLGLFIAKTLLERTGAEINFDNGSPDYENAEGQLRTGAIAEATWPMDTIAAANSGDSQPLGDNVPIQI